MVSFLFCSLFVLRVLNGANWAKSKESKEMIGVYVRARALAQRQQCAESINNPGEAHNNGREAGHAGVTWTPFHLYLWIHFPGFTFWRFSVLTSKENWIIYTF